MNLFHIRRARVRPEFAKFYPEIVPGVWMSAQRAARLVRHRGPRAQCREQGCARGRALCEVHFEFRGGASSAQNPTDARRQRANAFQA